MTVNMVREEYRKKTITPVGQVRPAYGPDYVLRHNDIELWLLATCTLKRTTALYV